MTKGTDPNGTNADNPGGTDADDPEATDAADPEGADAASTPSSAGQGEGVDPASPPAQSAPPPPPLPSDQSLQSGAPSPDQGGSPAPHPRAQQGPISSLPSVLPQRSAAASRTASEILKITDAEANQYAQLFGRGQKLAGAPEGYVGKETSFWESTFRDKGKYDSFKRWLRDNPKGLTREVKRKPEEGSGDKLTVKAYYVPNGDEVGEFYWQLVVQDILEQPPFVNKGYDWLTYETVFNKPKFRKTNQKAKVGLYAVEVQDVQVWVLKTVPGDTLDALCRSFFPDHGKDEVLALSRNSCWWQQQPQLPPRSAPYAMPSGARPAPTTVSPALTAVSQEDRHSEAMVAARYGLRLHLPRYVVMPYNYLDNSGVDPRTLGTRPGDRPHMAMARLDGEGWDIWRTASRSCIARIATVKEKGEPWPFRPEWKKWSHKEGEKQRELLKNWDKSPCATEFKSTAFKAEVQKQEHFRLGERTPFHISIKTGVTHVGFEPQEASKTTVSNHVDGLFSDYVKEIERLANPGDRLGDLLVQTELMLLHERVPAAIRVEGTLTKQTVDGLATRDLTVLNPKHVYFPPLSIGFVDDDLKTLTTEFSKVDEPAWRERWRRNWVEALARAKALLMLRYALQLGNPNVQNYLLEYDSPPGERPLRVVIRDVGDALIVRSVVWALFGGSKECPDGDAESLKAMSLPEMRYLFATKPRWDEVETGSTEPTKYGKRGIQFHWHQFSAHYTPSKAKKIQEELPEAVRVPVTHLMTEWMIPHSVAYVRTVERALGCEIDTIAWDELLGAPYDPARFKTLPIDLYESEGKKEQAWEENAAAKLEEWIRTAEGRKAICKYHNEGWEEPEPRYQVRLTNEKDQPLPFAVLYCKDPDGVERQRMTDGDGVVPFYSRTQYTFEAGVRGQRVVRRDVVENQVPGAGARHLKLSNDWT